VYKQSVRRRRAVLGLLVALSLILLTAYFGESAGGGLHALQRGVLQVLAPIQEGANRALKPVRDLAGWFGDTLHARSQRDQLRKIGRASCRERVSIDV
jgi:rod shape-determining protein MreC